MKKTILLLVAVVVLAGCRKPITSIDQQEWNTGALIWKRKLVSITDQNHVSYSAKDNPDLQDDAIVFYPDHTGRRYQGKKLFWAAPQVEELPFKWGIDTTQTNQFYLQAPGAGTQDPKNTIAVSVAADGNLLTIIVTGDRGYFVYKYDLMPQ